MSDQTSPRVLARALDLYSSDDVAVIGRARGHALCTGQLAILWATAGPDEAEALHAQFCDHAGRYVSHVRAVLKAGSRLPVGNRGHSADVTTFADRVSILMQPDTPQMSRDEAEDLARSSRDEVLPAIYAIIMAIQAEEAAEDAERLDALRKRADVLERMIAEVEGIGRTIGLVSLSAAVEAARTQGQEGRVFRRIAAEIRQLSDRASHVLDDTRRTLRDGV